MATGWDNGLCQDYCRGLSIWFASRLDARHTIRKHFMTQPNTQTPADYPLWLAHEHMRLYLSHYTPGHNVYDTVSAALASQPARAGAVGVEGWKGVVWSAIAALERTQHASDEYRMRAAEGLRQMLATPPQAQPTPVTVDVVKAFQTLYDAIDSCVELTPEVMLRARAALQSARSGQDGGDAGGEQVQRIDVQGVRVYGSPSAMAQDMPLIREVFGLAEDAQPAAVSAEGVFEEIDRKAEAGLCQMSHDGARGFLKEIRDIVATAPAATVQAGHGVRLTDGQIIEAMRDAGWPDVLVRHVEGARTFTTALLAANKEGQSHE